MGSFHNCESKRSLPLTLLGIEREGGLELEGNEKELGLFLLTLPEAAARGIASRWACMRE